MPYSLRKLLCHMCWTSIYVDESYLFILLCEYIFNGYLLSHWIHGKAVYWPETVSQTLLFLSILCAESFPLEFFQKDSIVEIICS